MNEEPNPNPPTNASKSNNNKNRPRKVLARVGQALQKVNVAHWIDQLEQDQGLADHLEDVNQELGQEQARKELCRQAESLCLQEMQNHLTEFIEQHPHATYEEWIQELHPDNVEDGVLDARFYVSDCDHMLMWKDRHTTSADQKDQSK